MIRKILAIDGGGILDIRFLPYLLKLSQRYDKQNIDILSLFDTFTGVSSGSIMASAFALREKMLQSIAEFDPELIASALKQLNADYSEDEIEKITKKLKKMKLSNCSSIIISMLIVIFERESPNIFYRTNARKIFSLNGLLFSKYGGNKKNVFDKYFDFKFKDIPSDRTLVIKSIDLSKVNVQIYTNCVTKFKNNIFVNNPEQSISETINFSSNAPAFFPFDNMTDGGIILNTSILEQLFLFDKDDLTIFKLSETVEPVKKITFDGIIGWLFQAINFYFYENSILENLLKYKYQNNIYIASIPTGQYQIDDVKNIQGIKQIGMNFSTKPAVEFINSKLK